MRLPRFGPLATAFTLALVVAACGGDDDEAEPTVTTASSAASASATAAATTAEVGTTADAASPTTASDEAFDPDGVVKIGIDLAANTNAAWDPVQSFSNFDTMRLVYDTFLRNNTDGSYAPGLARSWEIVDGSTLALELQPDVTFSDGAPFDGEAVKTGLLRNATAEARGFRAEVKALQDVIVDDATHVTLKFSTPVAGSWLSLLASGEGMIPSPQALAAGVDLNTSPVGAGPFVLESSTPEDRAILTKNPTYFEADQIKLAGIEFVHVVDPAAQSTAIRSGAVDLLPQISSTALVSELESADGIDVTSASSGNAWHTVFLCKSQPPFDDVRVRQALNFAVDREALSEALYGKVAPPVEGSWPAGHPFHDPALERMYSYDPDEARRLLAEAGYTDDNKLQFTSFYTAGNGQRVMEILQAQYADVGIEMELRQTQDLFGDFLTSAKEPAAYVGMQRQGTGKITRIYGATSPTNVCQYNNPDLESTMAALAATDQATPSQDAVDLWFQAQQIVQSEALSVFLIFLDEASAWVDNVGGVEQVPNYSTGSLMPDYFDLFITQ
jgi:peptide/nickel transport system substrate-binding protein